MESKSTNFIEDKPKPVKGPISNIFMDKGSKIDSFEDLKYLVSQVSILTFVCSMGSVTTTCQSV